MITILIFSLIIYTYAVEPQNEAEGEIQSILRKYLDKVPDIESKYVINQGLSRSISKYFKGKMSALPLFKISLRIDRTPVKIPWSLGDPSDQLPAAEKTAAKGELPKYKVILQPKSGTTGAQ